MIRLCIVLVGFVFCFSQTKLVSENNHSNINFSIGIAGGFTKVTGKFKTFEIDMIYHKKNFTKSVVEVNIDVSSIDTGIEDRDKDLQTPVFFDYKNHPYINFISSEITPSLRDNQFNVSGLLTMKGIEKEISFPITITNIDKNTIGVKMAMTLDRTLFNVGNEWKHSAIDNFLSDEVDIEVNFWTKKAKKKKKKKSDKDKLLDKGKKYLEKKLKNTID